MWRTPSGAFRPSTTPESLIRESAEELLQSTELQSLQDLAAVRVAVSISESKNVQTKIFRFCRKIGKDNVGFSATQWKQINNIVRIMLDRIGVPELIINFILEKTWPISFEIFKWMDSHYVDIGLENSSVFCWTRHLTIDYEKTAEVLVKNEMLDIKIRFKLACFSCLEEVVRLLWEKMNLTERRHFFVRGNLKKLSLNPIVVYWTYYIQELPIDIWGCKTIHYSKLYKYAVENGYFIATKYFLGKLKVQIRNRMIDNGLMCYLPRVLYQPDRVIKGSHFAIAYYLLKELDSHYREINRYTVTSLISLYFLEWPQQKHFLTFVNRMKCYMTEKMFGELLVAIFLKDFRDFKDCNYKKLFMEFWIQSPEMYRTYVNTESRIGYEMLFKFIKKNFGFIFDEKSYALKAKFRATVLQYEDDDCFAKEDVDFLKFLIQAHVTTKSSIERFPKRNVRHYTFLEFGETFCNAPLGELLYLIDGLLQMV